MKKLFGFSAFLVTIALPGLGATSALIKQVPASTSQLARDIQHELFLEAAIDRVMLGLEKKSRVMTPEEKERVAYHEAGHALIAFSVPNADPVHRVSIIPRTMGRWDTRSSCPPASGI